MSPRAKTVRHEFVQSVPRKPEPDRLYISVEYGTAIHLCACGCGREVVTPISPVGWSLHYDGDSVSLYPSIGNWSYPCRSHYWIQGNEVVWAPRWSSERIQAGRARDRALRERYYAGHAADPDGALDAGLRWKWLRRLKRWVQSRHPRSRAGS